MGLGEGNMVSEYTFFLSNIVKRYPETGFALRVPELAIPAGSICAVIGPNGSGKTTLLDLLAFLERPEKGRVLFDGRDGTAVGFDLVRARRQVTMVTQNPFLFSTTVLNNVAYGLRVRSAPRAAVEGTVSRVLERVGLKGFEHRKVSSLSGGEAQRVAIARALCLETEVLLLDEPTANVDGGHIQIVERVIQEINKERGTTVVFSSHNIGQAYRLGHQVIGLTDGERVDAEKLRPLLE